MQTRCSSGLCFVHRTPYGVLSQQQALAVLLSLILFFFFFLISFVCLVLFPGKADA